VPDASQERIRQSLECLVFLCLAFLTLQFLGTIQRFQNASTIRRKLLEHLKAVRVEDKNRNLVLWLQAAKRAVQLIFQVRQDRMNGVVNLDKQHQGKRPFSGVAAAEARNLHGSAAIQHLEVLLLQIIHAHARPPISHEDINIHQS